MSDALVPGSAQDVDTTWVVCDIAEVSVELPREVGVVTLREQGAPHRVVDITLSISAAAALRAALDGVRGKRPNTHELFSDSLKQLRIDVVAARIYRVSEQSFEAKLMLMAQQGSEIVDARPSDALVLTQLQTVAAPILLSSTSFA